MTKNQLKRRRKRKRKIKRRRRPQFDTSPAPFMKASIEFMRLLGLALKQVETQ